MHDPKVSICVPSYNHAQFLPAALDSALAQTYEDFEVVVVDDGSTDDSFAIAQSYAARYPSKVRLFTHPERHNQGISKSVNLAFEKARGQYLCGLPSDDLLLPKKLEVQVSFLERNPNLGWVYGPADFIDEAGNLRPEQGLFGADITHTADPLESLIQNNTIPGMTVLMRRSVSDKVGPHDETLVYSDWHFWVRMLAISPVAFIELPLVLYRVHTYNTSLHVDLRVNAVRFLEVALALRNEADKIGGGLSRIRTKALLDLQVSFHYFCMKEHEQAQRTLATAFTTDTSLRHD